MFGTLRLFLALLVVLTHLGLEPIWPGTGRAAVVIFYMISGYSVDALLAKTYASPRKAGAFLLDRAIRLAPQFVLWTSIALISVIFIPGRLSDMPRASLTVATAVANLIALPLPFFQYFERSLIDLVANVPAWSIGAEMLMYLAAPFLLWRRDLFFAGTLLAFVFWSLSVLGLRDPLQIYFLPPGILVYFCAGAALHRKDNTLLRLLLAGASLTFILAFVLGRLSADFVPDVFLGLFVGIILLPRLARLRRNAADEFLGALSYGVYLSHWMIVMALRAYSGNTWAALVAVLFASVCGYAGYLFVERPVTAWRRARRGEKALVAPAWPLDRARVSVLTAELSKVLPERLVAMLRQLWARNWFRLGLGSLLALWTTGILGFHLTRPMALDGDATFILTQARIFLQDGPLFSTDRLGFPAGMNLFDFPFTDFSQRLILFVTTMLSRDVITGVNLYFLFVVAANGIAGQLAMQVWLRRPALALIGGWAFATLPFFASRAGGHDFLAAYYPAALAFILLKRAVVAPTNDLFAMLRRPGNLVGLALVATSGVYFTFFALLLWSVCGTTAALRQQSWRRLLPFTLFCLSCLGIFLIVLYGTFPADGLPTRLALEQPIYAARLSDLLLVLDPLHLAMGLDVSYMAIRGQSEGFDFWPGPIFSFFALMTVLFGELAPASRMKQTAMRPVLRVWLLFCLLFATPFGLGLLFNLIIAPEIRAQNRLAPYFGFAAILMFLWWWAERPERRLQAWLGGAAGKAISFFVLALIVPLNNHQAVEILARQQSATLAREQSTHEQTSVAALLETLRRHQLKAVVQLPAGEWPEAPPVNGFLTYSHLLPYALSPASDRTAWSHGLTRNRPELSALTDALADPSCAMARLRALGYDSVMVDRRFYQLTALETLQARLVEQGATLVGGEAPRLLYAVPRVSGGCSVEDSVWLTTKPGDSGNRYLANGWFDPESWGRWGRDKVQRIWLPLSADQIARSPKISVQITTLPAEGKSAPAVTVHSGGKQIGEIRPAAPGHVTEAEFLLPADAVAADGSVLIEFRQVGGPIRARIVNSLDQRKLGVGLIAFRINVTDKGQ